MESFKFEQRPYKGEMTEFTKGMKEMSDNYLKDMTLEDIMVTRETYVKKRAEMNALIEGMKGQKKDLIEEIMQKVNVTEEKVTTRDGVEIDLYIYRPKTLESQSAPAYIYAHGGGGWAGSAKQGESSMAGTSVNFNCVVFDVEYRLAPEHPCPKGHEDFVDSINHVIANAAKYGIDQSKICLAGCSAGGWIICGAANILAKANDLSKIKAMFVHTGMLSNSSGDLPEDQWEFYEQDKGTNPKICTASYKLLTEKPWDEVQNDDLLFPGKVSDDILKMYPPTVVWTSEFDFLRRDNELFAARLKQFGKLAEMSNMPGVGHGYHLFDSTGQEGKWFREEEKLAFDHLVNN